MAAARSSCSKSTGANRARSSGCPVRRRAAILACWVSGRSTSITHARPMAGSRQARLSKPAPSSTTCLIPSASASARVSSISRVRATAEGRGPGQIRSYSTGTIRPATGRVARSATARSGPRRKSRASGSSKSRDDRGRVVSRARWRAMACAVKLTLTYRIYILFEASRQGFPPQGSPRGLRGRGSPGPGLFGRKAGPGGPSGAGVRCDPGAFASLGGQDVGVAGVGVAPAQVIVQAAGQHRVAAVVGSADDKGAQGPELRLDRVGPGCVGRREAQLDVGAPGPAPDGRGLAGRQVAQDDEQAVAAGAGGPDRLQRGQRMVSALALAEHTPQLVVAEAVAAVEVADAVSPGVGRGQAGGPFPPRPGHAAAGPDRQRPELVKREAAGREMGVHILDPVQLGITVRVGGLLPGPGALEGDTAGVQDLP